MLDLNFTVDTRRTGAARRGPALESSNCGSPRRSTDDEPTTIPAIALRCQIRIEPTRRRYAPAEQERLLDLFGEPERWGQTLSEARSGPIPASSSRRSPAVRSSIFPFPARSISMSPRPNTFTPSKMAKSRSACCSAARSSTRTKMDSLQVSQIPWEKEATFRLPVSVWKEMIELYYPNSAWLCLGRDVFDRLYRYKSEPRNTDLGAGRRETSRFQL